MVAISALLAAVAMRDYPWPLAAFAGLAVGAPRGFLLAAGVTLLALAVAVTTIRPRREEPVRPG